MNSQFLPPQQFGGPPQNFPPNRLSPQSGAFQSVPLGSSKPVQLPGGIPQNVLPPSHIPPSSTPEGNSHPGNISHLGPNTQLPGGQFPPNVGPPVSGGGRLPIPQNQLPPSQDQRNTNTPQTNPFNPPTSIGQNLAPLNQHNGQPPYSNSPQQFQNGPLTGKKFNS